MHLCYCEDQSPVFVKSAATIHTFIATMACPGNYSEWHKSWAKLFGKPPAPSETSHYSPGESNEGLKARGKTIIKWLFCAQYGQLWRTGLEPALLGVFTAIPWCFARCKSSASLFCQHMDYIVPSKMVYKSPLTPQLGLTMPEPMPAFLPYQNGVIAALHNSKCDVSYWEKL